MSAANGNGWGGAPAGFGAFLIDTLDEDALDRLAERMGPRLAELLAARVPADDGWLNPRSAAEYMGVKPRRIYDLKSVGALEPDGYDGRTPLWRRATLDAYVRRGG